MTPHDSVSGLSRRGFIGAAAGAAAFIVAKGVKPEPIAAQTLSADAVRHLVWVWQFSSDGAPNVIGADLQAHDLGILLKTHDGVEWMSKYDKSPFAVSGPQQTETLARYYEDAGVPFHAWAVVKGIDPLREAQMAADVLLAGARSLFIDLEPHSGFWQGTPGDALAFGQELRRRAPNAWVVTSVDPRPWTIEKIPLREFASFSNMLAPQQYWRTFDTQANYDHFAEIGMPVPPTGVTPEFLNDVSAFSLAPFEKAWAPAGQGATDDPGEWIRFVDHAYSLGVRVVSSWRYGVMNRNLFTLLQGKPPVIPPPEAPAVSGDQLIYTVEPGDTLGSIAARFGTSVDAIVQANGLANPNLIAVGQQLIIPVGGGGATGPLVSAPAAAPDPAGPSTHTVQPGETLFAIASRYGTSVDHLASLNGLANPNLLSVGQVIRLV